MVYEKLKVIVIENNVESSKKAVAANILKQYKTSQEGGNNNMRNILNKELKVVIIENKQQYLQQ